MIPGKLVTSLLKEVSRSFYLTLRVLPGPIRNQIGLAYLLARTTDTIADTGLVPIGQRLEALRALRDRIMGSRKAPLDFGGLARHQGSAAERVLLEQCTTSVAVLDTLAPEDIQRVRDVLGIIIGGQELDLRRFAGASAESVVALRTEADLDDYTYRVAGCVGEFWTRMCLAHLFSKTKLDEAGLLARGVRFGKGLQLVNILRDLPVDLRKGRCYLPEEDLERCGLKPPQLLQTANEERMRPLYDRYLERAEENLRSGWEYTQMLPRKAVRVRLACAWPLLIGRDTVQRLRAGRVLDPQQRIKITRAEVRKIMMQTVLYYPWPGAWDRLFYRDTSSFTLSNI